MTKKFWKDWQNRIGETKWILGFLPWGETGGSLIGYLPFKIISAKFNDDTVELVLEIEFDVVDKNGWHTRFEKKNFTFNRTEIATVEFIKY